MYFWGNDFEELCEKNCRQYRVYADIYPKNENGGYDEEPLETYTATRGTANAGAISFETAAIVSVKIVRGLTSGAFSYGGAFGGQLTLVTTADTNIPADDTKIVISVSFVSDEGQETRKAPLGTFFSESVSNSQFTKTIKAVDGISKLTKYYVPEESSYPMTASKLFEKVADLAEANIAYGIDTLTLNDPNITEAPLKKKGAAEGDESSEDEYYTYREIAGMIASINAGNAFISALNYLSISTPDIGLKREIPIKSVMSYTDKETVNSFSTTFWAQAYEGEGTPAEIDPLSEDYDPSIMVIDFPLSTDDSYATMQANIDQQIGGISYNGIVIKKQGTGRQEIGDLLAFSDTYRGKTFDNVLVMGIVYEISASKGFAETLYSLAKTEAQQQTQGISLNSQIEKKNGSIASVSGGVGEFTNEKKNSEIFNCYMDVKNENGAITIRKNCINEKTSYAHVSGFSNLIDCGDAIINNPSMAAAIVGGANHAVKNSPIAAIVGGQNGKISGIASFIGGGISNNVSQIESAIIAGKINTVNGGDSAIIAGVNNTIDTVGYAAIIGGVTNGIGLNGNASTIAGGQNNVVEVMNSAVITGSGNTIGNGNNNIILGGRNNQNNGMNCTVCGESNKVDIIAINCFVCGANNEVGEGSSNCIVCGSGAKVNGGTLIAGGKYGYGNVFYVDDVGNVFGKSFNIIGEAAAQVSENSEVSKQNYNLSETILQMRADIESLKAEIAELKGEQK